MTITESNQSGKRVAVVGGGIAGLAAAFRLKQKGFSVQVLESCPTVGGRMSTVEENGFLFNRAANILPASYDVLRRLAVDAGLGDRISEQQGLIGTFKKGVVHRMRSDRMMIDGLTTKLISWKSKLVMLKMFIDGYRMKDSLSYYNLGSAADFDTESAADYCARRANEELKEYIVEPSVRALFSAPSGRVSVIDFFYALVNFTGTGFLNYDGGIDFLVNALARDVDLRLNARVTHIESTGNGVSIAWAEGDKICSDVYDGCIITVTGKAVPDIFPGLDPALKDILLNHFDYCTVFNAHLGLDYRPDEPSLIVQIPPSEDEGLCVVTFDHNSSPQMAPAGKGCLSSYWLHAWSEKHFHLPDGELLEKMYPSFEKLLPGVRDHVEIARIDRWRPAVLMSKPGTYKAMAEFNRILDTASPIQLAGDYFCASSTNASALSGEVAAQRIASLLGG